MPVSNAWSVSGKKHRTIIQDPIKRFIILVSGKLNSVDLVHSEDSLKNGTKLMPVKNARLVLCSSPNV